MDMFIGYLGMAAGMLLMWLWLTEGSPYARKTKKDKNIVNVLCYHCGRMYKTGHENVRTSNYCNNCRD